MSERVGRFGGELPLYTMEASRWSLSKSFTAIVRFIWHQNIQTKLIWQTFPCNPKFVLFCAYTLEVTPDSRMSFGTSFDIFALFWFTPSMRIVWILKKHRMFSYLHSFMPAFDQVGSSIESSTFSFNACPIFRWKTWGSSVGTDNVILLQISKESCKNGVK